MRILSLIPILFLTTCAPSLSEQIAKCPPPDRAICVQANLETWEAEGSLQDHRGMMVPRHSRFGSGVLLGPLTPDAYGPGVWSDGTGRPFEWRTWNGERVSPIFSDQIEPNAYGPGVGMDPFGRAVYPYER